PHSHPPPPPTPPLPDLAPPPRGPLAASARRCAASRQAATRTVGRRDRADPARRCGVVCDVLASPGRNGRGCRRRAAPSPGVRARSEEHTSELQSLTNLV